MPYMHIDGMYLDANQSFVWTGIFAILNWLHI